MRKRVQDRDPLAILCVVESIGSSPGRAGFKMCIPHGSGMFGSIGGGSMEKKLVDLTYELFDRDGSFPLLKRQVHQADIGQDRSGMICSGQQTVAFFYFHGEEHMRLVGEIITALEDTSAPRELEWSSTGVRVVPAGERSPMDEHEWCYHEALRIQPCVAIVGAGHVSLALSKLMDQLGFRVEVYDDRRGLNTWHANTFAQQRTLVDFAQMTEHLPADPERFVVLASFGYRTDDIVLRQLIRNRYKYLGMLGSAEKIRVMFEGMRRDGFTEEDLARVHAPIGIPIHSRTPEEIAVSIAAEIIRVKNTQPERRGSHTIAGSPGIQ